MWFKHIEGTAGPTTCPPAIGPFPLLSMAYLPGWRENKDVCTLKGRPTLNTQQYLCVVRVQMVLLPVYVLVPVKTV